MTHHHDDQTVAERDDALQSAILGTLLLAYPGLYSVEELVRDMTERPDEFAERDAVLNALRDPLAPGWCTATAHSRSPRAPPCAATTGDLTWPIELSASAPRRSGRASSCEPLRAYAVMRTVQVLERLAFQPMSAPELADALQIHVRPRGGCSRAWRPRGTSPRPVAPAAATGRPCAWARWAAKPCSTPRGRARHRPGWRRSPP